MINTIMPMIMAMFIIVIIFVIQILTPKLTRKELFFGVRVPEEEIGNKEFKSIYKSYVKNNIVFTVIYLIVFSLLLCYFVNLFAVLYIVGIFIYLAATFYIYYIANEKVRAIKKEKNWFKEKKPMVVIDTNFTKEKSRKMLASPWWFLIALIIIIVNTAIALNLYDSLPDMLPQHWNAAGEVDIWAKKSYKSALMFPGVMLFMTVIMFFVYKTIGWSKQQISASNPKISKEQNSIFRYRWSVYMIIMAVSMNLFFTFVNFNVLGIMEMNKTQMMIGTIILVIIAIGGSVFMSLNTGQGGSRIKIRDKDIQPSNLVDRDDDKYWKLGNTLYVNKDDPSLFIEKRFGIGWTMNFGRIESILILVVFLALIFLLPWLLS